MNVAFNAGIHAAANTNNHLTVADRRKYTFMKNAEPACQEQAMETKPQLTVQINSHVFNGERMPDQLIDLLSMERTRFIHRR